jgi:hypothetical protein
MRGADPQSSMLGNCSPCARGRYRAPPSITPNMKVNTNRARPPTRTIAGIAIMSQTTLAKIQAIAVPIHFSTDLLDGPLIVRFLSTIRQRSRHRVKDREQLFLRGQRVRR